MNLDQRSDLVFLKQNLGSNKSQRFLVIFDTARYKSDPKVYKKGLLVL